MVFRGLRGWGLLRGWEAIQGIVLQVILIFVFVLFTLLFELVLGTGLPLLQLLHGAGNLLAIYALIVV